MRQIIDTVHDIICTITGRCDTRPHDDPYIDWMQKQEHAANASAERIRQRQATDETLAKMIRDVQRQRNEANHDHRD